MYRTNLRRYALLAAGFLGIWLFFRYLLPIFLPFALGLLVALAAEPMARFAHQCKLPRWAAAGLGVSLTLVLLVALASALGAILVKELGTLAGRLPDLQVTLRQASGRLQNLLESAVSYAPEGVQPLASRSIKRLFSSGSTFVEQATVRLPGAISTFLSRVPDGALGVGTGILSAFMFSVRLPHLKEMATKKLPQSLQTRLLPALNRSKNAFLGWLKAQCKLAAVTCAILAVGFLLLQIPYAPLWAILVALVDAVPLLGTGMILVPWALVCMIQRQHMRSVGLLCIYAAAFFTRTVLEPRLVGRHLGLDPLVTLIFLYLGYRFWGFLGMLLAPMVVAAATAAFREQAS